MGRENRKAQIQEIQIYQVEPSPEGIFEYTLGYFGIPIPPECSQLYADLLLGLAPKETSPVLAAYVPIIECSDEWPTQTFDVLIRKTFVRKDLFRQTYERELILGYSRYPEYLQDFLKFFWDYTDDNTFLVFPYANESLQPMVDNFLDDIGANNHNELNILKDFPWVASKGWSGDWINIFSKTNIFLEIKNILESNPQWKVKETPSPL